jgi:hypothetical protein
MRVMSASEPAQALTVSPACLALWVALGLECGPAALEEGVEYAACTIMLGGRETRYRQAKITPTKNGQFVTLWRRNREGITAPFDEADTAELFVVDVASGARRGQFVFGKAELARRAILSRAGIGGKRAIRVYPPWDVAASRQARSSQDWQLQCYLDLAGGAVDMARARQLYR